MGCVTSTPAGGGVNGNGNAGGSPPEPPPTSVSGHKETQSSEVKSGQKTPTPILLKGDSRDRTKKDRVPAIKYIAASTGSNASAGGEAGGSSRPSARTPGRSARTMAAATSNEKPNSRRPSLVAGDGKSSSLPASQRKNRRSSEGNRLTDAAPADSSDGHSSDAATPTNRPTHSRRNPSSDMGSSGGGGVTFATTKPMRLRRPSGTGSFVDDDGRDPTRDGLHSTSNKRERFKRRTSNNGVMSRLALQFPLVRASFLAVYRAFERYMMISAKADAVVQRRRTDRLSRGGGGGKDGVLVDGKLLKSSAAKAESKLSKQPTESMLSAVAADSTTALNRPARQAGDIVLEAEDDHEADAPTAAQTPSNKLDEVQHNASSKPNMATSASASSPHSPNPANDEESDEEVRAKEMKEMMQSEKGPLLERAAAELKESEDQEAKKSAAEAHSNQDGQVAGTTSSGSNEANQPEFKPITPLTAMRIRQLGTVPPSKLGEALAFITGGGVVGSSSQLSQEEIADLFRLADLDGSGGISWREFILVCACGYFLKDEIAEVERARKEEEAAAATTATATAAGQDGEGEKEKEENKPAAKSEASPADKEPNTPKGNKFFPKDNNKDDDNKKAADADDETDTHVHVPPTRTYSLFPHIDHVRKGFQVVARTFWDMDEDSSGQIDVSEFRNALFSGTPSAQDTQLLDRRFEELDFDRSGAIDLQEFLYGVVSWIGLMDDEEVEAMEEEMEA